VEATWLQQQSRVQLKAENILNLENILNVREHLQMSIIINATKFWSMFKPVPRPVKEMPADFHSDM